MTNVRIPPRTLKRIKEIREIEDPYESVVAVIELFENYPLQEEETAVEYNKNTGKPVKTKWVPSAMKGTMYLPGTRIGIYLGGEGYVKPNNEQGNIILDKQVERFLRKNTQESLFVQARDASYILLLRNEVDTGERGGGICKYIEFLKIKNRLTPQGLEQKV